MVDDYADTRAILLDVLVSHGCRVETAENGAEALEKARTWGPDLLVLDLAMPGIDGFDVARRLRADEATQDLPLVAYTASTDPTWRRRAEAAGFSAFLIKPTPPRELVATLRRFLPPEARPITWRG
ncbi:MAG TPA: response regulator, partial [Thermoanaerobaculia bacterium]|nr:response regulator [Thermoanaerobaculia bacterium]